jgi:hypothetical protein
MLATYLHDHLAGATYALDLVNCEFLALGIHGKRAIGGHSQKSPVTNRP